MSATSISSTSSSTTSSSSRIPRIWRVGIDKDLWDQAGYEHLCTLEPDRKRLPQSKGGFQYKKVPLTGDIALFVIKGVIVMIGIVEGDGYGGDSFGEGTEHQNHPCNRGAVRLHAQPTQRIWVNIIQFVSIPGMPSARLTWMEMYP